MVPLRMILLIYCRRRRNMVYHPIVFILISLMYHDPTLAGIVVLLLDKLDFRKTQKSKKEIRG
jgi:hypothetical protein